MTSTRIALFRGVNVGGRGKLPMKDLVALLSLLGLDGVRTYVQSGNAVFRTGRRKSDALAHRIRRAVRDNFGFEPAVLVLDIERLESVIRANPFPEAEREPASLHVSFFTSRLRAPDVEGLECLRRHSERFVLGVDAMYLHAPDGIARSRLAAAAERLVGVPMTDRNWRSVTRILALAHEVEAAHSGR